MLKVDCLVFIILILKLNAVKTCGVGGALVNLLFFTCSVGKFCVIQQDNLVADKLQVMKTYFVKNVKKQVDNVYMASEFTVLTESKKPIKISERFIEMLSILLLK